MGLFKYGKAGMDEIKLRQKQQEEEMKNKVYRLRLSVGETRSIVFLDGAGCVFSDHLIKVQGQWKNFTCTDSEGECPPCDSGDRPSYVCAFSVIDLNPYTDKKGVTHKATKKLAVFKTRALNGLTIWNKECGGDYTSAMFELRRIGDKECGTGESFKFKGKVDLKKLAKYCPAGTEFKEWIKPYDYQEILKPADVKYLRKLLGTKAVGNEDDADLTDLADDLSSTLVEGEETEEDTVDLETMDLAELLKFSKANELKPPLLVKNNAKKLRNWLYTQLSPEEEEGTDTADESDELDDLIK